MTLRVKQELAEARQGRAAAIRQLQLMAEEGVRLQQDMLALKDYAEDMSNRVVFLETQVARLEQELESDRIQELEAALRDLWEGGCRCDEPELVNYPHTEPCIQARSLLAGQDGGPKSE